MLQQQSNSTGQMPGRSMASSSTSPSGLVKTEVHIVDSLHECMSSICLYS